MSAPFIHLRSIDALAATPGLAGAQRIGGKGARLVWLTRHGFEIPRGWALDAEHFRQLVLKRLPKGYAPQHLLQRVGAQDALQAMALARDAILAEPMDSALADELGALWEQVAQDAPWGLAVRSSATCEDDELTAMAGLASTVLGVRGREGLIDAVRRVWASAMLPRALGHLASRGVTDLAMAVVVQVVAQADASGVMFTRPPPGVDASVWAADERLVNATLGLGAPVANGAVSPDMIRFAARTGELRGMTIARKHRALVVDESGSTFVDVPAARAAEPALSALALERLAAIADRLESIDPAAHDVEFVIERDRVLIVQSRPVVGAGFPEGGDADTVWSRANVGEALPGVATPLTWSVARGFSERGFRQAFGSLGCKVPVGATLVANVHGRFYLNLTQFMRIAAQVPGLDPRTLTQLGGGNGTSVLENQVTGVSRSGFYLRLPVTASRLAAEQLTLARRLESHARKMTSKLRARRERDINRLSDKELAAELREVVRDLEVTGTLMLACASASLAGHLALKTWISLVANGEAERITQVVCAGMAELESARPGRAIADIAALARHDPEIATGISAGRFKKLSDLPSGPVQRALTRFFDQFGDRALREAELSAPRWREDHAQVFAMIASSLRKPANDTDSSLHRAGAASDEQMAQLAKKISRPAMAVLRTLLGQARRTTQMRERMRAWVTRCLGEIRIVALEIDQRLLRAERSPSPGAVFFCTVDELIGALESGHVELGHVVRLRRAEHARDESRPDAPVTFVGTPPSVVLPPVSGNGTLHGLPACSGVVEGTVHVLTAGRELEEEMRPGEILVARTTDVALTPLFLVAAGVITELGGPLSHAALVAREYGVPTVVNVAGATVALRNGERVRVDGTHGTIERIAAQG
ncbi:MAG: phosphoenolpyruvate synthase [Deltaproteobacteria bacterium]|nr:phosphoenolpyruvate synthase [Deltaproteobacteria bacterium]